MNTKNSNVSSGEPTRCAIYARTALTPQTEDNAANQQVDRCREAAQKNGWTVAEDCVRIDRGRSGTSMEGRSGLQDLLALAATRPRPFDYLVCDSTDRLARNFSTLCQIVDTLTCIGIGLHFVDQSLDTSDPHFRNVICCMSYVDESYLKRHGERVRRGMMRSKAERARKAAAEVASISVQ